MPESTEFNRRLVLGAAGLAGVVGLSRLGRAGPLDPPAGPVTSTGKSLSDVEPRTAINATNTPGNNVNTYAILQPGSYYLTGNVQGVPGKRGILIASSDVTLDLNGFSLLGVAGSFEGIINQGAVNRVVIRNGTISGWGRHGLLLNSGSSSSSILIEQLVVAHNGNSGIFIGSGVVRNCICESNASDGILLSAGLVVNCSSLANTSNGIRGTSVTISGCQARQNGRHGFDAGSFSTISNCSSFFNSGNGFSTIDGSVISECSANFNTERGIGANNGCHIFNNLTRNNQQDGIFVNFSCSVSGNNCNGDGAATGNHGAIRVIGEANRIDGNNISYADRGLLIEAPGNIVVRNSVKGCTVNVDIAPGNDVGPIGSAASATSAWANILS